MNKKIIFFLIGILCLPGTIHAQYTPTKGDFSTELSFNPFNQNDQFSLDGLKIRYFLSDKQALRLNTGFTIAKAKTRNDLTLPDYITNESLQEYCLDNGYTKDSFSAFKLGLGYERHYSVHERTNLYIGAQIGFEKHWAKSKERIKNEPSDKYKDFDSDDIILIQNGINSYGQRSAIGFNADIFFGVDFYFYKGLYIGTEIGLGINSMFANDIEIKTNYESYKSYKLNTDNTDYAVETKFNATPILRLGWKF